MENKDDRESAETKSQFTDNLNLHSNRTKGNFQNANMQLDRHVSDQRSFIEEKNFEQTSNDEFRAHVQPKSELNENVILDCEKEDFKLNFEY